MGFSQIYHLNGSDSQKRGGIIGSGQRSSVCCRQYFPEQNHPPSSNFRSCSRLCYISCTQATRMKERTKTRLQQAREGPRGRRRGEKGEEEKGGERFDRPGGKQLLTDKKVKETRGEDFPTPKKLTLPFYLHSSLAKKKKCAKKNRCLGLTIILAPFSSSFSHCMSRLNCSSSASFFFSPPFPGH